MKFSVLMSVYNKEKAEYLNEALKSTVNQSLVPNQIVLVKDGPLNAELDRVIRKFRKEYDIIDIVTIKNNVGLGKALNIGLEKCKNEIIARVDSDDINHWNRFEKQVLFLKAHKEIDVCGSWIYEFKDNIDNIHSIKKVPSVHREILGYAKKRNPLNHMSVMFKKTIIIKAGGYQPLLLNEDYFLWARVIKCGGKLHNIEEGLVYARVDDSMYERRGGIKYLHNEIKLQKQLFKMNFINTPQLILNIIVRFAFRVIPNNYRRLLYQKLLRIKG